MTLGYRADAILPNPEVFRLERMSYPLLYPNSEEIRSNSENLGEGSEFNSLFGDVSACFRMLLKPVAVHFA